MLKEDYVHFVKPAPENIDYDKNLKYILIKDYDDLKSKLHLENEVVAWDTETNGLNPVENDIVGFSWSVDGITGYYCPVNHIDCKIDGSIELFVSELKKAKLSLLYNARFDIRMVEYYLKKNNIQDDLNFMRMKFIDVMNCVWLADTNYTMPSLKWATKHFLGYQPPKFLETLGDETNFYFVKVEGAARYACLDAINTFNVFKVCQCYHNEAGLASYLDTQATWIIGHLEETPLKIDTEKLRVIRDNVKKKVDDLEKEIFILAGEQFNIRSNRELTKIFIKLGIDTGERTKAGDMKTGITLLKGYLSKYPETLILEKIISYKEKFKFYNSYLKTLVEIGENQDKRPVRFSYKLQAADTTRLACCGENTIIYTDNGIKKIVDLLESDKVYDGSDNFYPAKLLNMGKRELFKVKFSDGSVSEFTNDHKLLVYGKDGYIWKELKDINKNDYICTKYNLYKNCNINKSLYLMIFMRYWADIDEDTFYIKPKLKTDDSNLFKFVKSIFEEYEIKFSVKNGTINIKYSELDKAISNYVNANKLFEYNSLLKFIKNLNDAYTYIKCMYDMRFYRNQRGTIANCFMSKDFFMLKDLKYILSYFGIPNEGIIRLNKRFKSVSSYGNEWNCIPLSINFNEYMSCDLYKFLSPIKPPSFIKDYILNHPIVNFKLYKLEEGRNIFRRMRNNEDINMCIHLNEAFELGLDIFNYITLISKESIGEKDTYTLSVDSDSHRYMSDSVISHNCGKDGKNTFFSPLNLQSLPKPKSNKSFARKATEEEIRNQEDILGWMFSPDHPEWSPNKCVEGMSLDENVRNAFIPNNGKDDYLVSIDMSGEEVRIVTNLFHETYFANIINNGGDIHHENSNRLFGAENYTKETRKKSKWAVFGMLYGQGERGFQQKFPSMSIEESKEFLDSFKLLIPNIVRGQNRMVKEAKKTGTFKTTFGHSIRVKGYFTSNNYKDKAFGERKVKNCYSPDTEFLTLEGWKYAKDITPITQISFYDPKSNSIRFTSAGERLTNTCTESVRYESKVSSWNVTKNHNMWIRDSRNDNWRFVEAEKLVNKKVFEEIASCRDLCEDLLETNEVETPIGKYSRYDLAKLFGWLVTDSSISQLNHIIITQTKEENFNEIIDTVKKFNGTFTIKNKSLYKSGKILYARICKNEFVKWCIEQMGGKLKKDRNIPKFILNSDISTRDAFIHSVINGDGNRRIDRNSVRVWHCSKKFVDAFQSLLIYSGYRCSYKEYKGKKGQSIYSINIVKSDIKSMDTRNNKYGRSNISIIKHEPIEFSCFNVPTHILITRHNGKVSFHGNSPIQGCAAEVLKLEFVRLWDYIFTKYPEIKFHSTIHDEINFSVPRKIAHEVIPLMIKCMTVKMDNWIVPLDCSLSVGYTMGSLVPLKYNFDTKEFIPDWEDLVEKKDSKVEENTEEDSIDEELENNFEDSEFEL